VGRYTKQTYGCCYGGIATVALFVFSATTANSTTHFNTARATPLRHGARECSKDVSKPRTLTPKSSQKCCAIRLCSPSNLLCSNRQSRSRSRHHEFPVGGEEEMEWGSRHEQPALSKNQCTLLNATPRLHCSCCMPCGTMESPSNTSGEWDF
jgi:hypothetical protein